MAVGTYASSTSTFTTLTAAVQTFADGFVAVHAKYTVRCTLLNLHIFRLLREGYLALEWRPCGAIQPQQRCPRQRRRPHVELRGGTHDVRGARGDNITWMGRCGAHRPHDLPDQRRGWGRWRDSNWDRRRDVQRRRHHRYRR